MKKTKGPRDSSKISQEQFTVRAKHFADAGLDESQAAVPKKTKKK
jgi:hypothetical protein